MIIRKKIWKMEKYMIIHLSMLSSYRSNSHIVFRDLSHGARHAVTMMSSAPFAISELSYFTPFWDFYTVQIYTFLRFSARVLTEKHKIFDYFKSFWPQVTRCQARCDTGEITRAQICALAETPPSAEWWHMLRAPVMCYICYYVTMSLKWGTMSLKLRCSFPENRFWPKWPWPNDHSGIPRQGDAEGWAECTAECTAEPTLLCTWSSHTPQSLFYQDSLT